ncbi:polymerase basic protein [Trichinella spiralis]|uniref:Polymerase basic protein n=1 Tax=Trichinella spiralis TaxID=6334 RepID=A0ABR3KMD2_TRISP
MLRNPMPAKSSGRKYFRLRIDTIPSLQEKESLQCGNGISKIDTGRNEMQDRCVRNCLLICFILISKRTSVVEFELLKIDQQASTISH